MDLIEDLHTILPASRIKARLIDRISYAPDAGFYYLLPQAIVLPVNEMEIASLFALSQRFRVPLVFRAGGSSLSGQAITDGILVDLSQFWKKIDIGEQGQTVRVQPGITGGMVNANLRKFNVKIGPDPSSINTAMIGGILSNNASGMCCGFKNNSYHTVKHIRFVLPDGNTFSTEIPGDYKRFETECVFLTQELLSIRDTISNNSSLFEKIRKKYRTKNTVGYSLNSFIDYERPLDIFGHLLIGAEGTLAFIAEAVLNTIPESPFKYTSLLYFDTIDAACRAIVPLVESGAEMVELMDRASLRAVENVKGMDPVLKTLPDPAAALLVEFQSGSIITLEKQVNDFLGKCGNFRLLNVPVFTSDPGAREFLWKVRKGLFPAVGAVRAGGTTVILEDVGFPLENLGGAILDLQLLFAKYNYDNAIIFGHAKDGNIHFVVTQAFDTPAEIERYDRFLRDVVELVVKKYEGTLKAEHGTGRNMAPFVETEWGSDAYDVMSRIKRAADPLDLLNPGVIINSDKDVHIKNLKAMPVVEEEVDKCIECGYCEHTCPSRDITLTPRQRIVVRRALAGLKASGNAAGYKRLLKEYQYDGLQTCAVDGLCASACPVDINTGDLVKRLRKENHTGISNRIALLIAKNFALAERAARLALAAGSAINRVTGQKTMMNFTKVIRKLVPVFPLWTSQLTSPPYLKVLRNKKKLHSPVSGTIVYFPGCISRLLGNSASGGKNIMEVFISVSAKAGFQVVIADNIPGACCGQLFSSKGYSEAYAYTANKIIEQLWEASAKGIYPVVMDISSCTFTLRNLRPVLSTENKQLFDKLRLLDSIDFLHDCILPLGLSVKKKNHVVLHPVCSLHKMGIAYKLKTIACLFAENVSIPKNAGCCGMAGDRGFLFPELTASATNDVAREVMDMEFDGYYSSTKTCEMAMTQAVGKNYESILYLADELISD